MPVPLAPLALLALLAAPAGPGGASATSRAPLHVPAGAAAPGGPGLALKAAKILAVASPDGPDVIDGGVLLLRDGRIEAVGRAADVQIPEGYEVLDVGPRWLMPGIIELHNHTGNGTGLFGPNDINDTVFLTNSGLRVSPAVVPQNQLLRRGVAGGVTTVLFIPGSGSNIGGQGVLLKIGRELYEDMELRNPGSMKLAQAGNPEGWAQVGVGRSFMNWNTRNTLRRGQAYAAAWERFEAGGGPEPEKDLELEVFRDLFAKRTQVSVHTQMYQVVLMTVTMLAGEFGLDAYIDHGSFDGYRAAGLAAEMGVGAILGPRSVVRTFPGFLDTDGKWLGMAAEYQAAGHGEVGFNTDCVDGGAFITPTQEELPMQAGIAVRYGMRDDRLASVKGLTIHPARAAGLDHRVGSLEPGKDADVLVLSGPPGDVRTSVDLVLTDGVVVYDPERDSRLW